MPAAKYRWSIVTTARWEAAAIVEWVAYHRSIGFEHIYIYCNDDDPRELYEAVLPFTQSDDPYVTFIHFGLHGQQRQMFLHFLRRYRKETEWIAFFDVDEFLRLSKHRTIGQFLASMPDDADCIYFNWVFFGTSGFKVRPPGSVLKQYTKRQRTLHPFTKLIVRTEHFTNQWLASNPTHLFWHDIGDVLGDIKIYNSIAEPCERYYVGFPDAAQASLIGERGDKILQSALLHHYTLKSEQDFQRRVDRGIKGDYFAQVGWKNMFDEGGARVFLDATNECEDRTLADFWTHTIDAGWDTSVVRVPTQPNVALYKAATQSSTSPWSIGTDRSSDAGNVVNGQLTSRFQNHTDADCFPWWSVDLGAAHLITEIWVYNRLDIAKERLSHLFLAVSEDGQDWETLFRKDDDSIIGGADGHPLIWRAITRVVGRYVRVELLRQHYLHLDQVEVYGELIPV